MPVRRMVAALALAVAGGAGVHVPQDDVEHRRRIAAELAAAGLLVAAATAIARARAATAA